MFDLLVYDRAKTAKLMRQGNVALAGKPIESALMPTGEFLILMKEPGGCTLHLLGASTLLPSVEVEVNQRDFHAPLLVPLTARKLMGGWQGINIINATRSQMKDALAALNKTKEVGKDAEVPAQQH